MTVAHVQGKLAANDVGVTTLDVSFDTTPAVGNHVIVVVYYVSNDPGSRTVSDNQGGSNTYTEDVARVFSGVEAVFWSAPVVAASGTFTVTADDPIDGAILRMGIWEVSGLQGTIFDESGQLNESSADIRVSSDGATDTSDEYAVFIANANGSLSSLTPDTGTSDGSARPGISTLRTTISHKVLAATGVVSETWTEGGGTTTSFVTAMATYRGTPDVPQTPGDATGFWSVG